MAPRRPIGWVSALVVVAGMVLGACGPEATPVVQTVVVEQTADVTREVIQEQTVVVEETVLLEVTPTPALSSRTGAWVDQLIFTEQDSPEAAVRQLQANDIDLYAWTVSDPNVFQMVNADQNLSYTSSVGVSRELTCNPVATFADGRINPFGVPKFREAVNWLLDRDYIVQEIMGGHAAPSYLPISTFFADYARYVDVARPLEAKYAYNPERARAQITEVMETMGATMDAEGHWEYNGKPVTLIALIRSEDDRLRIGDYVASQLETVGFEVDRQYKTRSDAAPLWNVSDPAEGLWSFYTGGWQYFGVSRDDAFSFAYYYTNLGSASPLWQAYHPSPEFGSVAHRLWVNDYSTMEERRQLFQEALPLALQDSVRIFLLDQKSFTPQSKRLQVAYDLAAGVSGSQLYPFTLRWKGQEGGVVRISLPGLLIEPWNPIAGSNWVHDAMPQRATNDAAAMGDPYTGLCWPMRFERADCVVKTGLPVGRTLDWATLSFADRIEVPPDAWADWNAETQTFIQAGQMPTPTLETNSKCTVTYPRDLWTTVRWHDGSRLSLADFMMSLIMAFDGGKKESPIYDEARAPGIEAWLSHFRGVQIESTDPLVMSMYDDMVNLDVEWLAASSGGWPGYPWTTVALGAMAEEVGSLAFSTDKAGAKNVEWTNFIAGPSLSILKEELDRASASGSIVYTATLGQYLTSEEIRGRYANLSRWYKTQGHFWIGTGPFWLDKAFPTEKTISLRRFEAYPDLATRWEAFGTPRIPVVEVSGPALVRAGSEATFEVSITFEGQPYPLGQIAAVRYLLFDDSGALVGQGEATAGSEGQYTVALSPEATGKLQTGSTRLEAVVTSKAVSIPAITAYEFVTSK